MDDTQLFTSTANKTMFAVLVPECVSQPTASIRELMFLKTRFLPNTENVCRA